MYWSWQDGPGRTAAVVPTAEVELSARRRTTDQADQEWPASERRGRGTEPVPAAAEVPGIERHAAMGQHHAFGLACRTAGVRKHHGRLCRQDAGLQPRLTLDVGADVVAGSIEL